jgi:transcriptional regulator with XRE-family HTH domain
MAQVDHLTLRRTAHAVPYVILRQDLIAARKVAGLTQEQLAERLGRPQSFVAKYEVGERFVDAIEFIAIGHVLGWDASETIARIVASVSHELLAKSDPLRSD